MRSKTFQRVLNDLNAKPWYYKLKIKIKLELYCILTLGLKRYILNKLKKR
jgi:hypothetical protein